MKRRKFTQQEIADNRARRKRDWEARQKEEQERASMKPAPLPQCQPLAQKTTQQPTTHVADYTELLRGPQFTVDVAAITTAVVEMLSEPPTLETGGGDFGGAGASGEW